MGDEREPWIGSAWMVATTTGDRRGPRPRILLTWALGVAVLLGALGAAGPHPVTAALPLPPVDTSEVGATGRVPDAGAVPLPAVPPAALPVEPQLPASGGSGAGIPTTMLAAYRGAESSMAAAAPSCHLPWALVAGIGEVESGHAYGGAVTADGTTVSPILGPQLDGTGGNAAIPDTDHGALDHDTVWDRAVGPTQFIPSSWRIYGADGNGDGVADPDNAFDAALATGRYLCAGGADLATAAGRHDAVFRYNHSEAYVATVLGWADTYAAGALPVPDSDRGIPAPVLASGSPVLAALPSAFPTTGKPLPAAVAPPAPLVPAVPTAGVVPTPAPSIASVSSGPAAALAAPAVPAVPSSAGRSDVAPTTSSTTASSPTTSATTAPPATTAPSTTTSSTSPTGVPPTSVPPTSVSSTTAPSTTPPATTTTTATSRAAVPAAQRCTASLPVVAKAFGVPVGTLTAATSAGPKPGQVTCTVSRGGTPLVVAVAATTAEAPDPVAGAGVSRTVPGGRVVLSVPPSAGVPAATATTALTTLTPAWT